MFRRSLPLVVVAVCTAARVSLAADHELHRFKPIQLTDVYYSEGANVGDIDGDGVIDAVYGPHWYKGPDFKEKHAFYPPKAQNKQGYSDHFFAWLYDFNGDGRKDIFTVGFPGKPGYVYENPGSAGFDKSWPKHEVLDSVCNESPQLINLVGDEKPELVCNRDGYYGYATVDWSQPFSPWTYHNISDISKMKADTPFGHGLGIGDIDGDGRQDILVHNGWFQQPASVEGDPQWQFHEAPFASKGRGEYGGAEMYAYDCDGDGDNDVITSLAAHDFGLVWNEQVRDGDKIAFKRHIIMGKEPKDNKYGLVFSELHSVNLVDMDGDGLKDIVTGKTFWSHHEKSPQWDAGAVVYWFKLARTKDGVDWIPFRAADDTGIGRQVTVADVNGDKLPDIIVGGMKGGNVLIHEKAKVSEKEWQDAQPKATPATDAAK